MDLTEFVSVVSVVKDALTALAIVIGGIWTILRFRREREAVPRLQWQLSINCVAMSVAGILLEVVAYIENKGKIRHEIGHFGFKLSILRSKDLEALPTLQPFAPSVVDLEGSLMPMDSEYTFIEPGVKARYCELVVVPPSTAVVYGYARFDYGREYDENECAICLESFETPKPQQTA